jgi:hypothetical protein
MQHFVLFTFITRPGPLNQSGRSVKRTVGGIQFGVKRPNPFSKMGNAQMKKFGLGLIAASTIVLSGAAQAADMGTPQYTKAPVVAASPLSAEFGSYVGLDSMSKDSNSYKDTVGVFGGTARVNYWFAPNWRWQSDLEVEISSATKDSFTTDGRVQGIMGSHLSYANQSYLFGVFGGTAGLNNLDDYGILVQGLVGVEAQVYLNNFTLYGQFGYTDAVSGSYANCTSKHNCGERSWFGRAVGRYFFTPNDKLQAEFGYAEGTYTGDGDKSKDITWGALYEHRFSDRPFSLYAEYAGLYNENRFDSYNTYEHQFMLGAKVYFGQGTLLSNDRNGTTLDMPTKLIRSIGWSGWNY